MAPIVRGFDFVSYNMDFLFNYQYIVGQCWWTGFITLIFADDKAKGFWECLYQFTYDVDWYVPLNKLQVDGDVAI